ncbi:DUF6491 family protein [Kordiimonas marina]|uniref:DUF6491 family protein n=1 Tax=Kordiimonas marina TaxID=2872312 RepID=UPI001FF655AC|nr:DUF6491 family protein [Kordiimonas marina]MCJ9429906.1 DUF6491 family protein [Kordiimonas marina]
MTDETGSKKMKIAAALLLTAAIGLNVQAADTPKAPEKASAETTGKPLRCITTDRIMSYSVESDDTVRLMMMGKKDVIMKLRRNCPQLHYNNYIAYTPVNGQLCARMDDIVTRTGLPCRIGTLTEIPRGAPTPKGTDENAPAKNKKK